MVHPMYIRWTMTLADYMQANGLDDAAMGAKIGRNRASISRYRRKLEIPSSEIVKLIVAVSDGAVTANELLQISEVAE